MCNLVVEIRHQDLTKESVAPKIKVSAQRGVPFNYNCVMGRFADV